MRPSHLEMQGFGAFRDRVVIDFDGIDFFALVGPTGSGKSTVIDAMCFALYGSVPRYDDERLVAPIISTGANEARVALRFTVGGVDYTAARVARRTAKGGATTKEARLEVVGEGGVLAPLASGAPEVNAKVQELLGLSFAHFTRCVVLPQGEFAKFLHDKPSERQEVLVKLLQLDVYRTMMQAANSRAAAAEMASTAIEARVEELGDLSDDALATASQRSAEVAALQSWLDATSGELAEIDASLAAGGATQTTVVGQAELLASIEAPPALAGLVDRLASADREVSEAADATERAQQAADAAHAKLVGLPAHATIAAALDDWAQLSTAIEACTTTAVELDAARQHSVEAAQLAEDTAKTLSDARSELEPMHELDAIRQAHAALQVVRREIASQGAALRQCEAAQVALRSEADLLTTRTAALATASAPLAQLRALSALLGEIADTKGEADAARAEMAQGADAIRHAKAALAGATEELRSARSAAEDLRVAHQAAAIANTLTVGDDCPVCHRRIDELGTHGVLPELKVADRAVVAAEAAEGAASQRLQALKLQSGRVEAILSAHTTALAAKESSARQLSESIGDPGLRAEPAKVAVMIAAAEHAERELAAVSAELADVDSRLRRADVDAAARQATLDGLLGQLPDLEATVRREPDADRLAARIAACEALTLRIEGLEAAHAAAQKSDQHARIRLATVDARHVAAAAQQTSLEARCARHQPADELRVLQLQVEQLAGEHAARLDELQRAQAATRAAAKRLDAIRSEEDEARTHFHTVRDQLGSMSPPSLLGGPLAGEWEALCRWSTDEHRARLDLLATITTELQQLTGSATAVRQARRQRAAAILGPGVADMPDRALDQTAAAALAGVQHDVQRIVDGRARTASLRAEQARHDSDAEVARMLGRLLSAKQFEQWLVSVALHALTATASTILERLSGQEYGLESTEANDFLVVDHRNADERRPIRTLSGGETFQASLALALALSQEISGLSARPGRSLDSIFLDEGFGTLDPATLDTVAGTIETLGQDGRMVGIVTHVRELAERVPVRFRVTKGERTSTLDQETT